MEDHMVDTKRRIFLQQSAIGLAAIGVSGLVLRSDARPTQEISRDTSDRVLIQMNRTKSAAAAKNDVKKVTAFRYGPFYRPGAPFRGKLNLLGEAGSPFVLSGRMWGFDTKR